MPRTASISVKKNAPDDGRYDRKTAKDGSPFFVLKAANGQPIGKSEFYSSTSAMENGIASVKKNAPDAAVDDKTA
ncbi:MAG: YegP family protein [Magnetospirillum sp.]|nr:YegP family protein [Magnetospirillum sp.]